VSGTSLLLTFKSNNYEQKHIRYNSINTLYACSIHMGVYLFELIVFNQQCCLCTSLLVDNLFLQILNFFKMGNSVLKKASTKSNVKQVTKKSTTSTPLHRSVFQQTTTLEVGEHSTVLKSAEISESKAGNAKIELIFKDIKSSKIAIDNLSFGNIGTFLGQWSRLKYLLSNVRNNEIVVTPADDLGVKEDTTFTVNELVDAVDESFNDIIIKSDEANATYEIATTVVESDYELDADDLGEASPDEIADMEALQRERFITDRNKDLNVQYVDAEKNGFQIYTVDNAKFAVKVDEGALDDIIPIANILFQTCVNKSYTIKIKQDKRYKNITSIVPK